MGKWEMVRLGDVLEYEQPTKYIVESTDYDDAFDTPVLTAGQSFILGYTNETNYIYTNLPVIIFDDFTTATKFVDFPFKVKSSAMKILRATEKADIKFLFYYMSTISVDTDLHKRYWISKYADMQIPLPPLEVQQQIADVLDRASALIEKRKTQIEKLDLLIKSQFIEMFGDPVTNPMGWEKKKLSSMGELNRGVSKHRPRNDPKLLGGEYPLIQTGDVANSGIYIEKYSSTYSELGLAQSKMWAKGTLCITIAANIAKTGILAFDACFPDSVVGFLPYNYTNTFFINYWFAFFQKILEEQAPESAQKNINLKILYELDVICPPIALQNEFVDFVQQVDAQKSQMQKSLKKLELNYKSLMQKCFRGEIF